VAPKKLILGVGAVVTFCNQSPKPVDIVFDKPEAVDTASCSNGVQTAAPTGPGNIAAFGGVGTSSTGGDTLYGKDPMDAACRRFSVPGIYHYHSTLFPSDTFEIEIKPEQQ
jgi:hypothetical protein